MTKARTHGAKQAAKRARIAQGWDGASSPQEMFYDAPPGDPTPEQRQHAHYERGGVERGGRAVWVNMDASPLRSAYRRGKLTLRQVRAGEAWEAAHRWAETPRSPRSCLDFGVKGHAGDVGPSYADSVRRWRVAVQHVGMARAAVLSSVCVRHEPIGDLRETYRRFRALIEGLNMVADHWGLATE